MDFSSLSMVAISNSSSTSSSSSLDFDMDSSICISPPLDLPSKLNAEAPAFVPRSASSPSLTTLPAAAAAPMHKLKPSASSSTLGAPQQAKTLLHVYTTPDGTTYHQITTHVPVQTNYLYAPQQSVQYHRPLSRSVSGGILDKATGQEPVRAPVPSVSPPPSLDSDQGWKKLSEEACNKIVNQVEYYFSDLNLATTDHLIRVMSKDPEGYVPMSVVSSFKKIKALVSSHAQLAKILRSSTKLVVSEDGKKVKRQHRLTETDMEKLQARIVIAENLPHDHCHQNLMKIFSAVGSVKMIRTCQPQTSTSGASSGTRNAKSDSTVYSNKLHAFVEYETIELAEKAVVELNERNDWRNSLKVRPLLKRTAKPSQTRTSKVGHESEANFKEDDVLFGHKHQISSEHSESQSSELAGEEDGVWRAQHNRGRGKGQAVGRPQYVMNNRGSNSNGSSILAPIFSINAEQLISAKQDSVPRMPDGTRGFSMGRGKPIAIKTV